MPNRSIIYSLQNTPLSVATTLKYQDMVIDRYNDNGDAWTKAQVTQMGGGAADPRQLFGYVSIGEAENYRDYWQASWGSNPPSWLGPENPQWQGNYAVKFWDAGWQTIMKQQLDGVMKQGFDGIYYDVVDVYDRAWVKNGHPNAAQDMVNLIKSLSDYAKGINPNFKVYINISGANPLLENKTLLGAIDGVLQENMYYSDSGKKNAASESDWNQKYLDLALAAGKNVGVVDYVSDAAKVADVKAQATADGYGYYTTNLNLKGINTTGFSVFDQGHTDPVPTPTPSDPIPAPVPHDEHQTFDFSNRWAKNDGNKVITTFRDGDTINLSAIDADLQRAGDQAFHLINGAFSKDGAELKWVLDTARNVTVITGSTDHDRQAEFKITLKGLHHLNVDDFIL